MNISPGILQRKQRPRKARKATISARNVPDDVMLEILIAINMRGLEAKKHVADLRKRDHTPETLPFWERLIARCDAAYNLLQDAAKANGKPAPMHPEDYPHSSDPT